MNQSCLFSLCTLAYALITALVVAFSSQAKDRRTDPNALRIIAYKVEFMWDGIAPEYGRSQVQFDWKGDPTSAGQRMDQIADIIRDADPDAALLVEVENEAALDALNSRFQGQGYAAVFVQGIDSFTAQDVAMLMRIDPIL